MHDEITTIVADGGIIGPNPSVHGLTWAYLHLDRGENVLIERSGLLTCSELGLPRAENNVAEFVALLFALEAVPFASPGPITVMSDSKNTIGRFFEGWSVNGVPPLYVRRMKKLRNQTGWERYVPVLIDGHPTKKQLAAGVGKRGNPCSIHNVRADALCTQRSQSYLEALR